jgi:hypothetical protein
MKKTIISLVCVLLVLTVFVQAQQDTNFNKNNHLKKLKYNIYRHGNTNIDNKKDPITETKTTTISSSTPTKWVFNGNECVKADILSVAFTVNDEKNYKFPHIVIGTDKWTGKTIIKRIIKGSNKIAIDKDTRKYQKNPTCDTSKIETTLINHNWLNK